MLLKTKEPMMILAGDIGGTKGRLGLFSVSKGNYHRLSEKTFPSQHYKGLEIIVKEFLGGEKKIISACFGVAGPVIEGKTKATNLPWVIHTKSLQNEDHKIKKLPAKPQLQAEYQYVAR